MAQPKTKTTITARQTPTRLVPQKSPSESSQNDRLTSITHRARRIATPARLKWLAIFIIALLPALFFYHQNQVAQQKLNGNTSSNLQTTDEVVKRVSRHILLPSGEQPTVATVTDASKVRNQSFFASSASGDKVLIYAQAKKAYLYRPSIDRIVEVAPLAPNPTTPAPAPTATDQSSGQPAGQ